MMEQTAARLRALHGAVFGEDAAMLWRAPSSKLVVFVSSTFTDTDRERNVLMEKILPELREKGRPLGIEVVFVDMRWGVRDENTLHHETWVACKRELERCYRESAGLFFLSLQGDKYGYRPLPRTLSTQTMEAALAAVSEAEMQLLREWYLLDENRAGGGEFVLKSLRTLDDKAFWDALPSLRDGGLNGAEFGEGPELLVGQSVTEWEARLALSLPGANERSIWLHRTFEGGVTRQQDPKRLLDDGSDRLAALKAHMRGALTGPGRMEEAALTVDSYLARDAAWGDYIAAFEARARALCSAEIARLLETKQRWGEDGCGLGMPGEELGEVLHHVDWAWQKASDFGGRESELCVAMLATHAAFDPTSVLMKVTQRVSVVESPVGLPADCKEKLKTGDHVCVDLTSAKKLYLKTEHEDDHDDPDDDENAVSARNYDIRVVLVDRLGWVTFRKFELSGPQSSSRPPRFTVTTYLELLRPLQGICLAVVGSSGVGKTAFMAKLAQRLAAERPDRPVLIRFCGTSKGSNTGLGLVQSLCRQLRFIFRADVLGSAAEGVEDKFPGEASTDYRAWVECLHHFLETRAVALLVDSLDQLTNDHEARSQLSYLRNLRPHVDTRVIVSCLPDEVDAATNKRYFYGCETVLRGSSVPRLEILPLERHDALSTALHILSQLGRDLSGAQLTALGASVDQASALHCRLAARIAATWQSSTPAQQCDLPSTVPLLIGRILDNIETEFGADWVRCALACITYSRAGVSDSEMQDLLSLDDRELDHVFQYSKPEEVRRLPMHVWLRLKGALQGLLVEREHGCNQWYHRQLQETAALRYQSEKQLAHELMAFYFGDLCGSWGAQRLVSRQPLTLNGLHVLQSGAVVNPRRCIEAPFHFVEAGAEMFPEACNELCSIDLVSACATAGHGFDLLAALVALDEMLDSGDKRVNHQMRWLLQDMPEIQANPQREVMGTLWAQPLFSIVRSEALAAFHSAARGLQELSEADLSSASGEALIMGVQQDFDALLMRLYGHTGNVLKVRFSSGGGLIVSCSDDKTVRLWDAKSGACLKVLEAASEVRCVAVDAGRTRVVSGLSDGTVCMWNSESGELLRILEGHAAAVGFVAFACDASFIVSAEVRGMAVQLWDAASGRLLKRVDLSLSAPLNARVDRLEQASDGRIEIGMINCVAFLNPSSGELSSSIIFPSCQSQPILDSCIRGTTDHICIFVGGSWGLENVLVLVSDKCGEDQFLQEFRGHTSTITCAAFSPGFDCIASGSIDKTIRVWDTISGGCRLILEGHSFPVLSVAWSPDGRRIVSGSHGRGIRVWDGRLSVSKQLEQGEKDEATDTFRTSTGKLRPLSAPSDSAVRHTDGVNSVSWSPHNQSLLSTSADMSLRIWDARDGTCQSTISRLRVSPDGVSGEEWDKFSLLSEVLSAQWSPDGSMFATGSTDNSIRLWGERNGQADGAEFACVATLLYGHWGFGAVGIVSWSADGRRLACGFVNGVVRIFSVAEALAGEVAGYYDWEGDMAWCKLTLKHQAFGAKAFACEDCRVWSLSWCPSGDRLVSSDVSEVCIWDVAARSSRRARGRKASSFSWDTRLSCVVYHYTDPQAPSHPWLSALAASSHASTAVSSSPSQQLHCARERGACVAWSPEGDRIATASSWGVKIWDTLLIAHEVLASLPSTCVAWSPGGNYLAACLARLFSVVVFSSESGDQLISFEGHRGEVKCLAWSADGARLASGSADSTVRVWSVRLKETPQESPKESPTNVRSNAMDAWAGQRASRRLEGSAVQ